MPKNQVIQLKSLSLNSTVPKSGVNKFAPNLSEFTNDEWEFLHSRTDQDLAQRISQGWALIHLLYNPEIYGMTTADANKQKDRLRRQIVEIENIISTRTEGYDG